MMLGGRLETSNAKQLDLSGANVLYRWKPKLLKQIGPVAGSLELHV